MRSMSDAAYSIDDLRDRLPELVEVVTKGDRITVTAADGTELVLMSKADLEGLEETLEILNDPDEVAAIKRGSAEAARADFVEVDDLRQT